MNIAIIAVAYNRVLSLNRLLESLSRADYSEPATLIISIDKSNTDAVEKYADEFIWNHGEKRVVKHKENLGLRNHMLSLGQYFGEFDALVVLEDDVSVSQAFFYYAKQCVEKYANDQEIAGISLYSFPVNYQNGLPFCPLKTDSDIFLMQCAQSWGEVWMRDSWKRFKEWYEINNEEFSEAPHLPKVICKWPKSSWLKYHTKYCIEENKFFVYPYVSLSTNNADAGTHNSARDNTFQTEVLIGSKKEYKLSPTVKYDGFFENLSLCGADNDVCVDLYGEKENRVRKRYWLTTIKSDYPIVKSYAMLYRPWDNNVLQNEEGCDIFLYDTIGNKTARYKRRSIVLSYMYRLSIVGFLKCFVKCVLGEMTSK